MKSLSASFKIIKMLKLMTQNPVSIDEILKHFEDAEIYLSKETISKYFATLRYAGCDIQKKKNKFYIKYPILNFSKSELLTLANFQKAAYNLNSKNNYSYFLRFLERLFILTNETENYRKISKENPINKSFWDDKTGREYKEKIEILSEFMGTNPQKLKISYEGKIYNITPVNFRYNKDSVCLSAYDNIENVNKNFALNKIDDIKATPSKGINTEFGLSTTFKISGKLKNIYRIREGEIVTNYENYIIVTNKKEDKTELFNRLLKYGTCCEILYPKNDRKKFITMIEDLILQHANLASKN